AGDPMWLISETGDGANLNVTRLDNPDDPTKTTFTTFKLGVNSYSTAVAPLQPDGSSITTNIDSRVMKAAEANNVIVASHAISNSAGDRDLARWYTISVSDPTKPKIKDQGEVTDATSGAGNKNVFDVYPTADINASGEIGMTYVQSGTGSGQF